MHKAYGLSVMAGRVLGRAAKSAGLLCASFAAGGSFAVCESDQRGPLFDPEALERGAKALKEINASPFAKKVCSNIEVSRRIDLSQGG